MRTEYKEMLERQRSAQKNKPPSLLYYGPPKVGKTELAATASLYWKGKEPTSLDDMLWLEFDTDGTRTLTDAGIDVPHYISWQMCVSERNNDVEKALLLMQGLTREVLKANPEIRYIVADTISMLDMDFVQWCMDVEAKDSDKENTQRAYGQVLNLHRRFFNSINPHPVGKIYLCHATVKSTDSMKGTAKKNAERTKKAQSADLADVVPQITGKGRTIYIGSSSMEAVILKKTAGNGETSRVVYPNGTRDFEGGSRWEGMLPDECPPNIQEILKMVEEKKDASK